MGPPKAGVGIGSKKPAAFGPQRSLHKSETFFEKVEAAEMSTDPPKREFNFLRLTLWTNHCRLFRMLGGKPLKTGMKQQNLFGQPLVEDPSKGANAKGKKKPGGKDKAKTDPKKKSKSPLPDTTGGNAAKGKAFDDQNVQIEDDPQATSNIDSRVQEVETQLEETQLDGSSPPADTEVETQPATETQTEEEETQVETQVDEDDNEPVSYFSWAASCLHADCRKSHPIRSLIGQLRRRERQR